MQTENKNSNWICNIYRCALAEKIRHDVGYHLRLGREQLVVCNLWNAMLKYKIIHFLNRENVYKCRIWDMERE